jgi:hypothetical protein
MHLPKYLALYMPKAAAGAQSYLHFATCKQHGCVETGETGRTYFKRSISITWFHRDRATILTSAHITFKTQLREHRKVSDIKEHYLHGQSARTMSLKAPALIVATIQARTDRRRHAPAPLDRSASESAAVMSIRLPNW